MVEIGRRLSHTDGVRVHRVRRFDDRVLQLAPPRVRLEDALLDLAGAAADDAATVAVLADACGSRRTTAARLLTAAERRPRLPRRARIVAVLGDVATGSCSALEQVYLEQVVRAHGLPVGVRQAAHRHRGDRRYRDVLLAECALCVELDGRLVHGSAQARDADLERDLDAVAHDDLLTVRLSWGQCTSGACQTAERLGVVLSRRGWSGRTRRCTGCQAAA